MHECYTFRRNDNLKTEPPQEDNRDKLGRIRKELNEIYLMRRGPSEMK